MMSGTAESTGAPHGHGSGGSSSGGFDLLKRATQKMMSKDSTRYVTLRGMIVFFSLLLHLLAVTIHSMVHHHHQSAPISHERSIMPG